MKKGIAILLFLISCVQCFAQEPAVEEELRQTIETFFKGFHQQDSVQLNSVVHEEIILQSVGVNQEGETQLHQSDFDAFVKSIISIPEGTGFREEIHSYKIKVDGKMANVWTPYSFYFKGKFSHCGVNNFQLIKSKGEWKIIYLIDTRRKEGCVEKE